MRRGRRKVAPFSLLFRELAEQAHEGLRLGGLRGITQGRSAHEELLSPSVIEALPARLGELFQELGDARARRPGSALTDRERLAQRRLGIGRATHLEPQRADLRQSARDLGVLRPEGRFANGEGATQRSYRTLRRVHLCSLHEQVEHRGDPERARPRLCLGRGERQEQRLLGSLVITETELDRCVKLRDTTRVRVHWPAELLIEAPRLQRRARGSLEPPPGQALTRVGLLHSRRELQRRRRAGQHRRRGRRRGWIAAPERQQRREHRESQSSQSKHGSRSRSHHDRGWYSLPGAVEEIRGWNA